MNGYRKISFDSVELAVPNGIPGQAVDLKLVPDMDRKTLEVHLTDLGELLAPLLQNTEHYAGGTYLPHRGTLGAVHLFLARLIVLEHSGNMEITTTEDGKENLIAVQLPLTFTPPALPDEEAGGEATEVR